jgi:hypothetical protein
MRGLSTRRRRRATAVKGVLEDNDE